MQDFGERTQRSSTAFAAFALWTLLIVSVTFAARAGATTYGVDAIGRANLDGSGAEQGFIATPRYSTGVAVDADHIYWANYDSSTSPGSYSIGRANLDGSGVEQRFISLPSMVADVAVDGAHIYWTSLYDGSVGRANLSGSSVNPNFIAAGTPYPRALAVDAQHIYWTTGYPANSIARANLDGSGVEPGFIDVADPSGTWGLAVDVSHIYWTNFGQHAIGRANLDGSGVDQSFVTGLPGSLLGVAVDSDRIYWTTLRRAMGDEPPADLVGTIGRANLDGSAAEQTFITGKSHVADVAVDAGHIYWVNQADYVPCLHCEPPPPDDTTPPDTTITKNAPNKTERSRVKFRFRSDDPDATFECRLDKKHWRSCSSPKTVHRLEAGRHRFRVRAVDASGNADGTPASDRFEVVD